MKNFIILLALLLLGVNANAQYTSSVPAAATDGTWSTFSLPYYTAGDDTASGADVIRMGAIMNLGYDVEIKTVVTKISGTIATTSALYVRVSPDGVNWHTLCEGETKSYKDTVFMANATTTASWSFTMEDVNARYIEVYYDQSTGTSPLTAPVSTIYYRRRKAS